jgi:colanic acid/amylovoran biosynthesis glycosyltransferase
MIGRAATFTRLCELARARYLQSWFFYDLSFMAMFAAQVLGIPRGISCHVDHELDDHPWKLVPLQLATADLVLAISDRTREELLRRGMLDLAGRLLVKRVGVDATSLRPLRGRRFDRPATADKPFELVSVCRIEPKKGLLTLVDACDLLRARGRAVRVRLVGGADPGNPTSAAYAAELRGRIAGRSLSNVVVEAGAIGNDGIPAALASADAFVAPYVELDSGDKDGIPTAVLEAMAAGLPIVGTSAGAMREAVADGREGILVPQRDAGALAGAIEALAADPAARSRLGVGAAARFDAEFDCRVTERELHARVRALLARGIVS